MHLCNWFRANKLWLSIFKTNFIIFGNKCDVHRNNPIPVLIDGRCIYQISNCKFLGILIDEWLNWSYHFHYVNQTISKNISVLNRLRHFMSSVVLKLLYNSLILPYLMLMLIFNVNVNIYNALEFPKEQKCGYLLWSIEAKMVQVFWTAIGMNRRWKQPGL